MSIDSQQDQYNTVHRGDISMMWDGNIMFFITLGGVLLLLACSFTQVFPDFRLGIIDAIAGIVIGLPIGILSHKLAKRHFPDYFTACDRLRTAEEFMLNLIIVVSFLVSVVLLYVVVDICHSHGLVWPTVGKTPVSGGMAFMLTFSYCHRIWYSSLPD